MFRWKVGSIANPWCVRLDASTPISGVAGRPLPFFWLIGCGELDRRPRGEASGCSGDQPALKLATVLERVANAEGKPVFVRPLCWGSSLQEEPSNSLFFRFLSDQHLRISTKVQLIGLWTAGLFGFPVA
jgi:hypothetical protein